MEKTKSRVRRTNLFLLLTLLILVISIQYLYGQNLAIGVFSSWLPLSGKVIVIDPGHGGIDGGATFNGILEKDINLDVSLKLKKCWKKKVPM